MTTLAFPSAAWLRLLAETARRSSDLHHVLLDQRARALQGMKQLVELQMRSASTLRNGSVAIAPPAALFSSQQLDAFGAGKISDCLGPEFARYDALPLPRIPNGDLKMMSRVTEISGQRRDFSAPAEVCVEYDLLPEAWFLRDSASHTLPCSLLMELGLQPCGFLSAWLDTYSFLPALEQTRFFFRNLDGSLRLTGDLPGPGATISTRSRLLSSVTSGETVIQKFSYTLAAGGRAFGEGEAVFGYFPSGSMINQAGLDGGKLTQPWIKMMNAPGVRALDTPALFHGESAAPQLRLSPGRLALIDSAMIDATGGRYGKGYVYASRRLSPDDWFYPYHFYGDPVMPGSLGVEAMLQALQAFALGASIGRNLGSPKFTLPATTSMAWRYRGQIVQTHKLMEVEVHVSSIERSASGVVLTGDASLWVDGLRIYEVKQMALALSA